MSSLKLHVFRGENDGTKVVDFRGENFIGSPEDEHRTVLEIDPAEDVLIQRVLDLGPSINALFAEFTKAQPSAFADVASALGLKGSGPVGLRVGVWDE